MSEQNENQNAPENEATWLDELRAQIRKDTKTYEKLPSAAHYNQLVVSLRAYQNAWQREHFGG